MAAARVRSVAGLILLAVSPSVITDPGEPALQRVTLLLGVLGFALLAAGWGGCRAVGRPRARRQAAWKRPLLALNRRLVGSPDLLVNTTALPCSPRDLARALEGMRLDHG